MSERIPAGQLTGFYKLKDRSRQCIDCIDGWCQMNCGPSIGEPWPSQGPEITSLEASEYANAKEQPND